MTSGFAALDLPVGFGLLSLALAGLILEGLALEGLALEGLMLEGLGMPRNMAYRALP